jgi:HTH-type transcriptional regulator / antitoxin HigA
MKTTTSLRPAKKPLAPKDYRSLCLGYLPRPIRTQAEFEEARGAIEPFIGFESGLTTDQVDYLEAVSTFLEAYDRDHVRWPESSPQETLRFLLDQNEMNAADLSKTLGVDRSLGSKILRGERSLTIDHIRILAKRFAVGPEVFF